MSESNIKEGYRRPYDPKKVYTAADWDAEGVDAAYWDELYDLIAEADAEEMSKMSKEDKLLAEAEAEAEGRRNPASPKKGKKYLK
jgi:hypothetical protein